MNKKGESFLTEVTNHIKSKEAKDLVATELNFHLKQARFFVQYYHLSHMFLSRDFLSMPHYPYAPDMVKLGISWNFYN